MDYILMDLPVLYAQFCRVIIYWLRDTNVNGLHYR